MGVFLAKTYKKIINNDKDAVFSLGIIKQLK